MAWLLHTLVFFIAIQSVASQITVTFGNDYPRVNESEPIGTIITTMTVTSIENNFITVLPLQQTSQLINLHQEISTRKYYKASILLNQELDYETYGSTVRLIFGFSTLRQASTKTQTLTVGIIDVNDNKPRFIGAPYAVSVPENEVANTAILTVNATDPDTLGAWATLSYSIQTSDPNIRATFEVDNVTGVVELTKKLDYETQTFYELTLAATDGGGLVGTTQMFVTVTDVQDMPPYFTGLPYMKTVKENSLNGSEVITVRAFDGDRGNPNTISYLQLTGACESFFKVDETSGEVTVVETIDRDSGTVEQQTGVCALTIEAREVNGSGFGASANTTVTLTISDEDDNNPLFNTSDCQAEIQENMPNGLPIVFTSPNVLTVQDIDATVIFSTFDLQLGGADAEYFEVSPKSVVGSGSVIVRVKNSSFLDYEQRQHARLTVIARGTANPAHQSTSTVSLNIINLNDNSPVFDNNTYIETVEEGSAVDTPVVTVHATDEDLPPYGKVTYNLLGGDGMFKVDRDSGSVTVARVGLDRETKPRYFLTIEASDPDGRKSTTSVIVYLGDRNEAPFFLRDYDGFLKENEDTFSKAIQVQATDNDIGNNAVLRYLVNRTEPTGLESNFTVSETTGIVSIANPLDYEQLTSDEVILTIEARDLGTPPMSANVNITLTVQDENDEAPKFSQNGHYTAKVKEDSRRGAVVVTVDATDGDRSSPNNLTYFVIVSGDKGSFRIDPNTGIITTTGLLDYDRGERRYDINIQVQDRGSPGKSSNGIVQIDVENVNDENPAFPNGVKTVRIDENQTVSSLVANFSARDVDPDKDLLYTVAVLEAQGGDQKAVDVNTIQDWFRIDSQTGEIAVYSTLDRETAQQVTLEVTVNDTAASFGHTPQTATGTLTVVIQDVDDNYPQFQQQPPQYNAEIVENSQPGQPINFTMPFEMKITDKDEGVNSEFDLVIVSSDTFVAEPSFVSGSANILINVKTNTLLDYEILKTMNVIVVARERGGNLYTSTATVTLSILDANDNYPDFGQETASASISEHSFEGDVVILVNAYDADSPQYGMGTYELQGGQNLFQIDSATGNITRQTGELNYEVQKQYFMTVIATDLGNLRTTLQLTVNITDYNDETPQFTRDMYEADLKENEMSFSRDLKVQALDGDEPNTKNSKVSYCLLQTRLASNFTINSTSGEISVVSALDFEALSTGLIHLTVFAKDHGYPQLTATATINIYVQDVNDNRPEFSPSTYTASVQEGSSTGTRVVQVSATDADRSSPNNEVFFLIQRGALDAFTVNSSTGRISVIGIIDRDVKGSYNLVVVAMDRGNPPKSASATVKVTVEDINNKKPEFVSSSKTIEVNETDVNSTDLYRFSATDADQNSKLSYSITDAFGSDSEQNLINSSYIQNIVIINNTTGVVQTARELDREMISSITLIIQVEDLNNATAGQTATGTLVMTILDVNDNTPTFQATAYTAEIHENMQTGVPLTLTTPKEMTVTDLDAGQNSEFSVSVQGNMSRYFSVTPPDVGGSSSLSVRVKDRSILDYEMQHNLTLTIVAQETKTTERFKDTATITLNILDMNDNSPTFVGDPYQGAVLENQTTHVSVLTVQATDPDSEKYSMGTFSLRGGDGKFIINETNGTISTNTKLDREKQDIYSLIVTAIDKGNRTETAQVTINVNDVNDETPRFKRTDYSANIEENDNKTTPLLKVEAEDKDKPGTNNSEVRYIISPSSQLAQNFTINNTSGEIYVNGYLDYERLPNKATGVVSLGVVAKDEGSPVLSSSVTVSVIVQDVNDNTPYFSRLLYQAEVTENSKTGVFVVNVSATDDDGSAPNNQILYVIDSGAGDNFRIDGKSGNITVQTGARIDRETQASYSIVILAIDQGTPSKTGTTTLSVEVQDINDEAPTFTTTSSSVAVRENSTETEIYMFTASDPDSNSSLLYEVLWNKTVATDEQDQTVHIDLQHWFSLDNITGNLTSKPRVLDRETAQTVVLKVRVTDLFAQENIGKQTATATLRVTLFDVNDNYPEIQQGSSIDVQVSEGAAVDTVILKLDGTDRDEDTKVSFSTNSTSFNITSEGRISLAEKIDREKTPFILLNVYATDNDTNPQALTSMATVNVTILDINDNDPKFNHTAYSFTIPENRPNGSFLGIVTADDIDEGPNANVTYILDGLIMSNRFYLNPLTGELTTKVSLNREERDVYTISVTARDNPLLDSPRFSKATVTVNVTDVNDNAPEFTTNYTQRIPERFTGGNIVQVSATDADLGENATVWYKLSTLDGNETELFNMSSTTGEVGMVQSLIGKADIYNMIVIATDEGPGNLTGETFLTIQVLDENLNKPQFTGGLDILPVPECANVGKTVFTFTATDADKDKLTNGRVRFNISEDTPADTKQHFRLEAETGILSVGQQLNREVKSSYQIRVVAYDDGIPSLSSTTEMLTIQIQDVNDKPPKFEANITKIFSINENTNGNLGKIEATDEDTISRICYKISDPLTHPNVKLEKLNTRSVMLRVVKHFDRESMETLGITVVASDCTSVEIMCGKKFAVNETSTAELTINIKDVNDNPPHFVNPLFRAGIRNKVPIGTPVFRLDTLVTDKDTPPFSRHTFFAVSPLKANKRLEDTLKAGGLGNYNNSIVVSTNGSVTTDKTFTAANGYFSLMVNASDDAGADMCELQIFIIADFQVLKITFYKGRDDLKKLQNSILRTMTNSTGLTFVSNDELAPHIKSDGSADPYQTDMFVHAVDEKGNILNADQSQDVIDNNIDLTNRLIKAYSLIKVEVATVTNTPVTNDDRSQFILVAVVCLLAITLLIIIFISFDRIRRYRRKLKAATIDVKVGPKTQEVMVVNENPIFNKELELRQEQGSETQSVISDESIDDNRVYDNVEPGSDDEQEMTVDFSYETEQRDRGDKYLAAALKQHDMRKMSKGSFDTVGLSSEKEDETKENFVFYTPKEGEREVTDI